METFTIETVENIKTGNIFFGEKITFVLDHKPEFPKVVQIVLLLFIRCLTVISTKMVLCSMIQNGGKLSVKNVSHLAKKIF